MSGYPPQPAPWAGPAQTYQQPMPQQYAQQQYAPPVPPPMSPPPQSGDFAAHLLSQYKGLKKAAASILADDKAPPESPAGARVDNFEEFLAGLEYMDEQALLTEQRRYRQGTKHWLAIQNELDSMAEAEEVNDVEDLEEADLRYFHAVRVDDGRGGWIDVAPKLSFESKSDLINYLREKYPYSRSARYSKITKGMPGQPSYRVIQDAPREMPIRAKDEVDANVRRDMARSGQADPFTQMSVPSPPPGMSPEMQLLYKSLSEQQLEAQRNNAQLIQAMLTRDKPDNGAKTLELLSLAKEMFMEPMMRMLEANKPVPGDPRLALDLAGTITKSAMDLSKLSGGGGGGGDNGTLGMLRAAMSELGPLLLKPAEAPHPQQQLPAPDLPGGAPGAAMQKPVAAKMGGALSFLVSGRLRTDQLPRYAFRNLSDAEINWLLSLDPAAFAQFARGVAAAERLPAAYMQRPDVRAGFEWVHGEIHRLAALLNMLENTGRIQERASLLDWKSPCVIPWDPARPIIGEEAAALFAQHYPDVVAGPQASDADLPPMDDGPPLRVVREDADAGRPVDLFGGDGRLKARPAAPPSDPDFATNG